MPVISVVDSDTAVSFRIRPDPHTPLFLQSPNVGELCQELGITRQTLYRHVSPTGELREDGAKLLAQRRIT